MLPHQRTALSIATVIGIVLAAMPMAALGHVGSNRSAVTLNAGYGYFEGQVRSPNTKCRANRSVKLFKEATGTDPLLRSTRTNNGGAWAIFRPYEEGTFYVKVPARTLRTSRHTHRCKATTSPRVSPPMRVTLSDSHGWSVSSFDCLEFEGNPQTATPREPIFVNGPGLPPLGFGSLQLIDPDTSLGFSFTQARWDGLDGRPLSSLNRISYSTYLTGSAPPPIVKIYVDVTGDGGTTEEIRFTPSPSAAAPDRWQAWTASRSTTWATPDGSMSLSAYQAANPSAEFIDFQALQLWSDCPEGGNQLHYMDAVVVGLTSKTLSFDLER